MSHIHNKKSYPKKKGSQYYLEGHHLPESILFGTLPSFIHSLIYRDTTPLSADWFSPARPDSFSQELAIYWIGHASFLVQIGGYNLLLDPVFGSPSLFFKRKLPPGIAYEHLPPINKVLYSHNHPDHFELVTARRLAQDHGAMIYVPEGDGRLLGSLSHKESTWWQTHTIDDRLQITFLPAAHWSCSGLFNSNTALWGSWMIEYGQTRVYFGGDTAYFTHFSSIADHFGSIDVALLPIAPEEPRDWMKRTHMNGADAVQAFIDLKARHLIPMHWGTFHFGVDALPDPIKSVETAWQKAGLAQGLTILKIGGRF